MSAVAIKENDVVATVLALVYPAFLLCFIIQRLSEGAEAGGRAAGGQSLDAAGVRSEITELNIAELYSLRNVSAGLGRYS